MEQNREQFINRRNIAIVVIALAFFILILRFFTIQIIGMEKYRQLSESNRIRERIVNPIRGLIFDRNKVLIVDNVPAYSISVIPFELKNKDYFYSFINKYFPDKLEEIKKKIKESTPYRPVKILQVDLDGLTLFEENKLDFPGVLTQIEPQRDYPSGIWASHFLGYIKEIDENEIEELGRDYYRSGDIIGKDGLEKEYEQYLRGEKGLKYLEVDARGQELGEIDYEGTKLDKAGYNLILSYDRDLQKKAEELLEGKMAAVVMIDPNNGEILSSVSKPDFDPFFMNKRLTPDEWDAVRLDSLNPLLNRATQGYYPPGSTFKLVSVIAVLNDSILTKEKQFSCPGYLRLGNRVFHCHLESGHGTLNMVQGIERSCNVYFYNIARDYLDDVDTWAKYAKMFGFGQKTHVDLPEENSGVLPDRAYLDNAMPDGWTKGHVFNQVIGQGFLITTPLQLARFAAAIGTKGKLVEPHYLISALDSETDSVMYNFENNIVHLDEIREDVWDTVREGMYNVVHGEHGTAKSLRRVGIPVGGKTGTAQHNPNLPTHAWFIGFAPYENPEVAICVIVENGGAGSAAAAPIAAELFKKYFELKEQRKNNILSTEINR